MYIELLWTQNTKQNVTYINANGLRNLLVQISSTYMYTHDMHMIQSRWREQIVNIDPYM